MYQFGELTMVKDLSPADWLRRRLRSFAVNVNSVVPVGFAAYTRLLHPAYLQGPTTYGLGLEPAYWPVSWAEIANRNGKVVHPEAQFEFLAGQGYEGNGWANRNENVVHPEVGLWDIEPEWGSLPPDLASKLAKVLSRYTTTPEVCWFAVWNGWPEIQFIKGPTFDLPGRSYYLFKGPCRAAAQSFQDKTWGIHRSATLWWPDDHAWCVATDIDLVSTYIGGTELCMGELLTEPGLEVLKVEVSHGIRLDSDHINNSPPISAE